MIVISLRQKSKQGTPEGRIDASTSIGLMKTQECTVTRTVTPGVIFY